MEYTTENLDFFLSGKIIIFKTFYYRGKTTADRWIYQNY